MLKALLSIPVLVAILVALVVIPLAAQADWFGIGEAFSGTAKAAADGTKAVMEAKVWLALIAAVKDSTAIILLGIILIGAISCFLAPMYTTMRWMRLARESAREDGISNREIGVLAAGAVLLVVFGIPLMKFGWFLMDAAESGIGEMMVR
jgi:hypothetical protein